MSPISSMLIGCNRKRRIRVHRCAWQRSICCAVMMAASLPADGATFQRLGQLPGSNGYGEASDVSGDGLTAVGYSQFPGFTAVAFRWTDDDGLTTLGPPTPFFDRAFAANQDGSVIGGRYFNLAVVWTEEDGLLDISPAGVTFASVLDVSGDGTTAVGSQEFEDGSGGAFRWTEQEGVSALTPISRATGTSYDGAVVSGHGRFDGVTQPYRWTQETGAVPLGTLRSDGTGEGRAQATSADGMHIVGFADADAGTQAFLWTEQDGMIDLAAGSEFAPFGSYALEVSADGSVIGGAFGEFGTTPWSAFVWTEETGMLDFQALLTEQFGLGRELRGWRLREVHGISDDGQTLVGVGRNPGGTPEGWIARLDAPIDASPADFDLDDDVDVVDGDIWQANFGMLTGAARHHGDANFDHAVNARDFLIWQREIAMSVIATPPPSLVPEPTGVCWIAAGLLVLLGARPQQGSPFAPTGAGRRPHASGVTLIELLVALAILAVLVALLIPAIQSSREAARRTQCKSQLKQIGLAVQLHVDAQGFYPSGGWDKYWNGDPGRGFGRNQPGSWIYNILPFAEQAPLHDAPRGRERAMQTYRAIGEMMTRPVELFYCPSRRGVAAYPDMWGNMEGYRNAIVPGYPNSLVAKSDYAANSGDGVRNSGLSAPVVYTVNETTGDHCTESFSWSITNDASLATYHTGVMFYRSEITVPQITDGLSRTYLLGEKYLNPDHYLTGADRGDDQSLYTGYDWDNHRLTNVRFPPLRDKQGHSPPGKHFGSAHPTVWHVVFCDLSVQALDYNIAPEVHRRYGNRLDGEY